MSHTRVLFKNGGRVTSRCGVCAKATTRRALLKRQWDMTPEQYDALMEAQAGLCAICARPHKILDVDHDHETNEFRGLLCGQCNQGIGSLKDDPVLLASAMEYLLA